MTDTKEVSCTPAMYGQIISAYLRNDQSYKVPNIPEKDAKNIVAVLEAIEDCEYSDQNDGVYFAKCAKDCLDTLHEIRDYLKHISEDK